MKRPMLISGITVALSAVLFLVSGSNAALCVAVFGASVLLFFAIKRKKLKNRIFLPFLSVVLILNSVCFFTFTEITEKKNNDFVTGKHNVTAKIINIPQKHEDYTLYTLKTEKIDGENKKIKLLYYGKNNENFELYDIVSFKKASLSRITDKNGNTNSFYAADNIFLKITSKESADFLFKAKKTPCFFCLLFKENCINSMKYYLDADEAGLLSGMVFGDKSLLSDDVKDSFRISGVSHLLAVSGLHTSLWCGILFALLGIFKISDKIKAVISLLFLAVLCIVSAFTPSVLRASLMMCLIITAPLFNRQTDSLNSLGFAVTLLVLQNPFTVLSPGFILSVSATAGVICSGIFKNSHKIKTKNILLNKAANYFVSSILVSVFSAVFTLPACAAFYGTFSIIAPVTNLFAVKLAFFGMVTGLFSSVFSLLEFSFIKPISKILFIIPRILLRLLKTLTGIVAKTPFACVGANAYTVIIVSAVIVTAIFTGVLLRKKIIKSKTLGAVLYSVCTLGAVFAVFFSFLPLSANTQIAVSASGYVPAVSVRCGGKYALINVPDSTSLKALESNLPQTPQQKLALFAINDTYFDVTDTIKKYKPEAVSLSKKAEKEINENKTDTGDAVTVSEKNFTLAGKITVRTVDSYGTEYVIITKKDGKTAVVSKSKYNSFSHFKDQYGTPDILILSSGEAENFASFCDTLVVCGNADKTTLQSLKKHCKKLLHAEKGDCAVFNF